MSHGVIAVIDDDPSVRALLVCALKAAGYAAQPFADGRAFLGGHHPATRGVVLDMGWPVPHGRATLRAMRARGMGLPVLTTGTITCPSGDDLRGLDATEFLPKPFRTGEFLAAVARVIGAPA